MSERFALPSCSSLIASLPLDQRPTTPYGRHSAPRPDHSRPLVDPSSLAFYTTSTVKPAAVRQRPDLAVEIPARTGSVDFTPSATFLLPSSSPSSSGQWTPRSTPSSRHSMPVRTRIIARHHVSPLKGTRPKRKQSGPPNTKNANEKTRRHSHKPAVNHTEDINSKNTNEKSRRGNHRDALSDIEDILYVYLGVDAGVAQGSNNGKRCRLRRRKADVFFSTKVVLGKALRMCLKWAIDSDRLLEFQQYMRADVDEAFRSECVDDPIFEAVQCVEQNKACAVHGHPDFRACELEQRREVVNDMVRVYTRHVQRERRAAGRDRRAGCAGVSY